MLEREREQVERALSAYMGTDDSAPLLLQSMKYSLLDGGKRIRPCLMLLVSEMLGGDREKTLPFACALEMVHCYSLIHDDLPAMDNDAMRRGKPSNHVRFGEDNAILAGDGLLTKAGLLLMQQDGCDDAKRAIFEGAYAMVSGQSDDLNLKDRNPETLDRIHFRKTGALFRAAFKAGAYVSNPSHAEKMGTLGDMIGLLFQMTDDLLDAEKDQKENKLTYVTYYGEAETNKRIEEAAQYALNELRAYDGEAAQKLCELVLALRNRTE